MATTFLDAAKTLAPVTTADTSAGMNKFAPYFGPATHQPNLDMDPYRKRSYDHMALPDAYQGRNFFMGTLITTDTMTRDSFYTQVLLPVRRATDGEVAARGISWNVWTFDKHFADVLPEETPATLISSRRESNSRSLVRRGKAFELEHGFMGTPEGREAYSRNLEQLMNLVNETNNFDVVYELLNVDVSERMWTSAYGYVRQEGVRAAIEGEKMRWAILQKYKNGFEKMDAEISMDMRKRDGRADTWILHEKMMAWLQLVPSEKTDHNMAGERGPARVESFDSTRPIGYLSGRNQVYLSRSFSVGKFNEEIDPWMRERQIGEYFLMASEYQHNDDVEKYNTEEMSPEVYDEATDDYSVLSIRAAIEHTVLFAPSGRMAPPLAKFQVDSYAKNIRNDPFIKRMGAGSDEVRPIEVWGEMSNEYLPTDGVMRIARSAARKLGERYPGGLKALSATLRDGRDTLRVINERPVSQAYVNAVRKANPDDPVASVNDTRYVKSNAQTVWKTDPITGTLKLPDLVVNAADPDEDTKKSALVGFANPPGLLAAKRKLASGNLGNYDELELKTLANLANLVEDLVEVARQLYTGSMFIDPKFTAPQYPRMSAASVLMDNLLGTYQEALWMPTGEKTGSRKGAGIDRIAAEDTELRESLRATANQLGHWKAGDFDDKTLKIFGTFANGSGAVFKLPLYNDTGANGPFAASGKRAVAAALYARLNVFNGSVDAATPFLNLLEGGDIDKILGWATKNYKAFQNDSAGVWKAYVARQAHNIEEAKKQDAALSSNAFGTTLFADKVTIAAQYGSSLSADDAAAGTYYRTPLTLSATQILTLARQPNKVSVTVSRPGTFASVAASASDLRIVARKIMEAGDAKVELSSYYMRPGQSNLSRTYAAHVIGQQQPSGTAGASRRAQIDSALERRAVARSAGPKRRRIAGGGKVQEDLDYYDVYAAGDGIASDSVQTQRVAQGLDGMDEAAGGLVSEIHSRLGAQYRLVERGSDSALVKLFGKLFLGAPATRQSLQAMARNNVVLPIVFMAARPHMRYRMRMGVKMLAGGETGNTFVGDAWFELSDDTQKGMHHADLKYWSKSIVTNGNNVYLAFDIFAQQGMGGASVQPISLEHYDPGSGHFGRNDRESMFFIPLPYSSGGQSHANKQPLDDTIDLSGNFQHFDMAAANDKDDVANSHYATSARMNAYVGWRTSGSYGLTPIMNTSHPWRMDRGDTEMSFNTTVCRAHQRNWSRTDMARTFSKRNTGHWGDITIPGCREIRNGGYKELKEIESY